MHNFWLQLTQGSCYNVGMQKITTAQKIARTYRFDPKLVHAIQQLRLELRMRPSETSMVETALWEFIEREKADAKRVVRR